MIQNDLDPFFAYQVRTFRCPSKLDRPLDREFFNIHPNPSMELRSPATIDYAVNAGNRLFIAFLGPTRLEDGLDGKFVWPETGINGVVDCHRLVRARDIHDGLSNTIMVGEKFVRRTITDDSGDNQTPWSGFGAEVVRWTDETPVPDDFEHGTALLFGTSHRSVAPFAFSDGHHRLIRLDVNRDVFGQLGSRNDGEL